MQHGPTSESRRARRGRAFARLARRVRPPEDHAALRRRRSGTAPLLLQKQGPDVRAQQFGAGREKIRALCAGELFTARTLFLSAPSVFQAGGLKQTCTAYGARNKIGDEDGITHRSSLRVNGATGEKRRSCGGRAGRETLQGTSAGSGRKKTKKKKNSTVTKRHEERRWNQ
ncbi:hypothetical protein NDU88_003126 [Pleurodeles waltl]|uniref:Uncharacterized protein n=1 Tax=Pleurodeles waltl TaxID=8319 RepID=A0AAV7P8R4_PLEWA|nr:hypothetical protein NDU88_003126 [Pleurodeles waltl]